MMSSENTVALINDFNSFVPLGDEDEDTYQLENLCEKWEQLPADERFKVLPAMIGIFERNPLSAELGTPGPLVHALESDHGQGYETELIDSVKRKPAYYTIWMLNRILNAEKNDERRTQFTELLQSIAKDENVHQELRDVAEEFLSFQNEG